MMGRGKIQFRSFHGAIAGAVALLLLPASWSADAERPLSAFEQANLAYEQGNYREAIQGYDLLLNHGTSSQVLFNLGNAYFRNGDAGKAILNYRRARHLAPRDADILANLNFARQTVPGTISIQPSVFSRVAHYLKLDEITLVATVALWLCLGLLALRQWQPRWRAVFRPYIMGAGLVFVVASGWLAVSMHYQNRRIAIITAEQASIHYGPLAESQVAFTANDGAELLMAGSKEEWVRVTDRSGRTGWVRRNQAALFP